MIIPVSKNMIEPIIKSNIEYVNGIEEFEKIEHKPLADTYIKIAEMHIDIYKMLHDRMVALIEEEKSKGVAVPIAMQSIWDYEHEKLVKEFAESKILIEEYKKNY